jgi:hypothetical protein
MNSKNAGSAGNLRLPRRRESASTSAPTADPAAYPTATLDIKSNVVISIDWTTVTTARMGRIPGLWIDVIWIQANTAYRSVA